MLEIIKKIREKTGAGVVDVKKALDEAGGNEEKAIEIIKKKGQQKAAKKSERSAGEGVVASYVHSNGKIGAIDKIYCETDFVARNEEFLDLARDIAMHITAMNPEYLRPEDVPDAIIESEREIWKSQIEGEKKPPEVLEKIFQGKEKKFREELSLLTQSFVKNPQQTVSELISEKIAKTGENIQIGEFFRLEI
jgi:elongation factor Ts